MGILFLLMIVFLGCAVVSAVLLVQSFSVKLLVCTGVSGYLAVLFGGMLYDAIAGVA